MKAYFVSDIHLKSLEEPNGEVFQRFLQSLVKDSDLTHLFLLGDIFDLWIDAHDYFVHKFAPIIEALKMLQSRGVGIHYFEGNHDLYLQRFWQNQLGFIVHGDREVFQLGPFRASVEHGDMIDEEDHGYLFLRWFLRTPVLRFLARNLPAAAVKKIGERASQASRNYTTNTKIMAQKKAREKIHAHAVFLSQQDGSLDFVISGHLHVRDDFEFSRGPKKVHSLNLGTWLEKPVALLLNGDGYKFVDLHE